MARVYTCPMHPEIVQNQPGSCPICGMSLESRFFSKQEKNLEFIKMLRLFWMSLALTILVSFLDMGFFVEPLVSHILQACLTSVVVLFCGFFIFARAWKSVVSRSLNMFTLLSIGIGSAYLYSMIVLLFFKYDYVYFEAASAVTTLVLLGQVLELKAREKAASGIRELLQLAPNTAKLILEDGREQDVAFDQIKKGDRLRVRPGDKVPTDGVVLEGESLLDESMITGESTPTSKKPGDKVTGATLNGNGSFIMRAEKVGEETLLFRIVQMVGKAQSSKAPMQKLADRVSSYFVLIVLAASLLTLIGWGMFAHSFSIGFMNAIAVLIIACPCALGLATPMSIMVAMAKGAKEGILVKDADTLQAMAKVDTVIFDKTGTLTEGKPKLCFTKSHGEIGENDLLQLVASIEVASGHPFAVQVLAEAKAKGLTFLPVEDFKNFSGKGVTGKVNGKTVAIGSKCLMMDLNVDMSQASYEEEQLEKGNTLLYVAVNGSLIGALGASDPINATALDAIQALYKRNLRLIMITGDRTAVANLVGKKLGIKEIEAEVLPENKLLHIKHLQERGHIVAMAGDGINDAAALAQADVGIAMGTGTDVTIESASITLMKGDLRGVAKAKNLSIATMRNIKQNLCFAFFYNTLGIPIAAGLFYPWLGILLSPTIASMAMILSSVCIITNAIRLKTEKL